MTVNKEPQLSLPSTTLSQSWLVQGEEEQIGAPPPPTLLPPESGGARGATAAASPVWKACSRDQQWAHLSSEGSWGPGFIRQLCLFLAVWPQAS